MRIGLQLVLVAVAACHNATGELTVTNEYMGPCPIKAAIIPYDDVYAETQPFASGAMLHEADLQPGIHKVTFDTSSASNCCQFYGAGQSSGCEVYVAAGVTATVRVVTTTAIPGCQSPQLVCSGAVDAGP